MPTSRDNSQSILQTPLMHQLYINFHSPRIRSHRRRGYFIALGTYDRQPKISTPPRISRSMNRITLKNSFADESRKVAVSASFLVFERTTKSNFYRARHKAKRFPLRSGRFQFEPTTVVPIRANRKYLFLLYQAQGQTFSRFSADYIPLTLYRFSVYEARWRESRCLNDDWSDVWPCVNLDRHG